MSTISVPLPDNLLKGVKMLVQQGIGETVSEVVRKAIQRYLEDEAVNAVLKAAQEPSLKGDLDELAKKI